MIMYDELIKRMRELASIPEHCEDVESCDQCPKEDICLIFTNKQIIEVVTQAADAIEELSMKLHGDEAAIVGMKREIERMVVSDKPRWIPVTERLPENGQRCLVYTTTHQIGCFAKNLEKVDKYDFRGEKHHGWYYLDSEWGFCEILNVTHWMPLPEPPKEEAE